MHNWLLNTTRHSQQLRNSNLNMLALSLQQSPFLRHFQKPRDVTVAVRLARPRLSPWTTSVPRLSGAAAAATSSDLEQPVAGDGSDNELQLPFPSKKLQPQPSGKERAALRAYSETLAKEKRLQRLQVGAQGITFTVLMACMDVLMKHEYLRVKLGEGCGLERKQTAALLANLLDAVVVGQVGFTITLYRKKGLPRPDNLSATAS